MNDFQKRLLLINLPGESLRTPEEHCGIAFLKAYVNRCGYSADILDAFAEQLSVSGCKLRIANWIQQYQSSVRYIGISPFVTSHKEFVEIGEYIRQLDQSCYIYAGGHYASLNKEYLLKNCEWLDAIIVGEGELTTAELLEKGIIEMPGLYTRNTINFCQRERIYDLDILPFQDRYLSLEQLHGQPMAITTSRGCYGECSFCSISSFYKLNTDCIKQTFRSAESVSKEIFELVEKYHIHALKIVDDNFFRNNSDEFLEKLTEAISDLRISFRLSARPNDITMKRALLMKEMGVTIIGIGVESADPSSLQMYNKGISIEESKRAISILNEVGITCLVNYIMFNPILDLDGLITNCKFVEKYADTSIFHRINSHLWLRATDPIVNNLKNIGLCTGNGFPYIDYQYKTPEVLYIKKLFDMWCEHNMREYYYYADILMAQGCLGNETYEKVYRKLLIQDINVLKGLIKLFLEGKSEKEGLAYVENCITKDTGAKQ